MLILFIDISRAFDSISHSRLLAIIIKYEIGNPLLSWLSSYLPNQFWVVNISGCFPIPVLLPVRSFGVAFWSFSIPATINEISNVIHYVTPFLFADEMKIVCSFDAGSFNSTLALITESIKSLDCWCSKWFMKSSADKSSLMI